MGSPVTIKDVARLANVSVATVSRALNGHENVAEEVRNRVIAIAKELRYSPHHAARSLSSRRTNTIGVVLPDLYGEFFSELMRGIDQIAREHSLHLLVSSYHGNPEEQGDALRNLRGRIDGLLLMSPSSSDASGLADSLDAVQPAVLINTRLPDLPAPALTIDNHQAASVMVRHLVDSGRRRIAMIAGPADNFDANERLAGYRDALAQALPGSAPWVVQGDFSEASGHAAAGELLASTEQPDAVFAANDMMALGCLFACLQADINVPAQIAVTGFDDIPLARYTHPPLTTMRIDIAGLGARAMRLLLQRIERSRNTDGEVTSEDVPALQAELIVRGSSVSGTGADS